MTLRLIPDLDKSQVVIAHCSRPLGKTVLLGLAIVLLRHMDGPWLPIGTAAILATLFPAYRIKIVSAVGILFLFTSFNGLEWISPDRKFQALLGNGFAWMPSGLARLMPQVLPDLLLALGMCFLMGWVALLYRYQGGFLGRRPVLTSILGFFMLMAGVSSLPLGMVPRALALFVVLWISKVFWFFCYSLLDREARNRENIPVQAGLWLPSMMLYCGSTTPFTKGSAHLSRIEARNAEELTVTQIKCVKLLVWAFILIQVDKVFSGTVHGRFDIPSFSVAMARSASGRPFALWQNWACLVVAFLESLLAFSIWGHQIVACLRLMGFKALRNTYKPLHSKTIAEFWNRYYYYFKELLADLFFYPTYFSVFKTRRKLRTFFATFMAAGVGNAVFHFIRDFEYILRLGWWKALTGFQTYLFYCMVLSVGIAMSQIRNQNREVRQLSWFRKQVVPVLCVGGFYCIIHIFDQEGRTANLGDHFVFLGRLFGF